MKLWDQIRDRGWFYITALIAYGLILLFLTAYRVSSQLIIFISGICILFVIAEETIGYLRKRAFYNSIAEKLEILDKKYLIHEMLQRPSFLEGQITFDTLCEANKSMCVGFPRAIYSRILFIVDLSFMALYSSLFTQTSAVFR